ncbi:MAG: DNA repair protein RadC [Bacteroidales bacterium]|jgi:DNA repair protein RadC|nr:DNA repair protein RadC [Bacteroidales bacterium]MDD4001565.1 DNA repair protein RadC [Bacteroidales bacterium]MDD4528383.1 DNA repair protein RadC [Bacteroidales bacterium]MDD4828992.1 DNA repair protein RadC [Bacteroidales bacterium]
MENEYIYNSIKNWAKEDRPREKLMQIGKKKLTNAELLAIIIGSGSKNESAVQLAQRILNTVNNNINELSSLSYKDLMNKFKGIGEAKSINIVASLELGNRRKDIVEENTIIKEPKQVHDVLFSDVADLEYETFWILLMSNSQRFIKKVCISEGGWSETNVDLKKLFKICLENNSSKIILAHNHPSGNILPSESDKAITERIFKAGKILSIQVLDHIIFGKDRDYYSFAENNIMNY